MIRLLGNACIRSRDSSCRRHGYLFVVATLATIVSMATVVRAAPSAAKPHPPSPRHQASHHHRGLAGDLGLGSRSGGASGSSRSSGERSDIISRLAPSQTPSPASAAALAEDRRLLEHAQREFFKQRLLEALNSTTNGPRITRKCIQAAPSGAKPVITGIGSSPDCTPAAGSQGQDQGHVAASDFIASLMQPPVQDVLAPSSGGGGKRPASGVHQSESAVQLTPWAEFMNSKKPPPLFQPQQPPTRGSTGSHSKGSKKKGQGRGSEGKKNKNKVNNKIKDTQIKTERSKPGAEIYAVAEESLIDDNMPNDVIVFNLDKSALGNHGNVSKADLNVYVRYRKQLNAKRQKRFINLTVYRLSPEKVQEKTYDVSIEDRVATLRVPLRHTRWHKLLLPTSIIQETIDRSEPSLTLRIQCGGCQSDREPTVVLRDRQHGKKKNKATAAKKPKDKTKKSKVAPSVGISQESASEQVEQTKTAITDQSATSNLMTQWAFTRQRLSGSRSRRGRVDGSKSRDQLRLPYLVIKMAPVRDHYIGSGQMT